MNAIRIGLLTSVTVFALGGVATAADFIVEEPALVVDEVSSIGWSAGPYIGVQAGIISLTSVDDYDVDSGNTPYDPYYNSGAFGGTVGVFAGYDAMVGDGFVLGVSGEVNLQNLLVEQEGYEYYNMDWDGAIKLRAGMLVNDSTLLYATLGYAFGHFTMNEDWWGTGYTVDHTVGGVVVGAGLETMVTDDMFVKVEGSATFYDTLDIKYEDTSDPYSYWDITPTVLKATLGLGWKF